MMNPVATILLDFLLIGGALGVLAGMVAETATARRPGIGARRRSNGLGRARGANVPSARISRTTVVGQRRAA